ncbi:hypothetical protein [Spirosoma gilvum]
MNTESTPKQLTQEDRILIDYHTTASGARQQLDELIDEFVSEASSGENIAVINELFFNWIKHMPRRLNPKFCNHIAFNTLRITTFLTKLAERWERLEELEKLAGEPEKGGVSYE